jgi:hypothetical protein
MGTTIHDQLLLNLTVFSSAAAVSISCHIFFLFLAPPVLLLSPTEQIDVFIIFIIYLLKCKWVFTRWQW